MGVIDIFLMGKGNLVAKLLEQVWGNCVLNRLDLVWKSINNEVARRLKRELRLHRKKIQTRCRDRRRKKISNQNGH